MIKLEFQKTYRALAAVFLLAGLVGLVPAAQAADFVSTITYTTNVIGGGVVNPNGYGVGGLGVASAAMAASNSVVVSLNAQSLLLKELLGDHQKRAADASAKSQADRAKWENELIGELQEKLGHIQKSLDQISQSWSATTGSKTKSGEGSADDELIFLSAVEDRLSQIGQELMAAVGQGQGLAMQMSTNKAPENIQVIAYALEDNQRTMKQLQREQLDLELRKLEFRAIRKVFPKPN